MATIGNHSLRLHHQCLEQTPFRYPKSRIFLKYESAYSNLRNILLQNFSDQFAFNKNAIQKI